MNPNELVAIEAYFEIPENLEMFDYILRGIKGKKTLNINQGGISALGQFLANQGASVTTLDPPKIVKGEVGLPFCDSNFELIVLQDSRFSQMSFLFYEINRVLKPGGHYLSDELGWEGEHLREQFDFTLMKPICNNAYFHARKP